MRKTLLIGFVLLLFSFTFAFATTNDALASWSGNTVLDDSGNDFTLTANDNAVAQGHEVE